MLQNNEKSAEVLKAEKIVEQAIYYKAISVPVGVSAFCGSA